MKKSNIKLTTADALTLKKLQKTPNIKTRTYKRIIALESLNSGSTYDTVSDLVGLSKTSLNKLASKYRKDGLSCLYDEARPGRPISITAEASDKIKLLALSEAPEGYSQWSLRLLADKVIELGHIDSISHTQVQKILKKTN